MLSKLLSGAWTRGLDSPCQGGDRTGKIYELSVASVADDGVKEFSSFSVLVSAFPFAVGNLKQKQRSICFGVHLQLVELSGKHCLLKCLLCSEFLSDSKYPRTCVTKPDLLLFCTRSSTWLAKICLFPHEQYYQ